MLKVANSVISASRITGVLPVVNGGTGVTTSTGTGNTVLSATPTLSGDVTLSTGNLVIGTAGKGIDFSATPGTGTSELLSDYEEGTWTPLYTSFTFGGTTTTTNANYVKIGKCVYVTFSVADSVSIACTFGVSFIDGLPYAVGGSSTSTSTNENTGASIGVGLVYIINSRLYLPAFTTTPGQKITTSFYYFV
jgi:hypothetical protein